MSLLPLGVSQVVARRMTPEPERHLPRDPVAWVRDDLSEHPWSRQREILRSVVENRRTAVPSAHGTGKTYIAARAAAWWIAAHPPGEAEVVTTAPTEWQVKSLLWKELARAHRAGELPGTIHNPPGSGPPTWAIGDELVAYGRKPRDYVDPNEARQAFQGEHARYLLVVLDEATGIPAWLWEAAMSLITGPNDRALAIGNPDDPATPFGEACKPGSRWHVLPVSAFDTPAFTGERVPEVVAEGLVSRAWVADAEADYGGTENPLYMSKVLGVFPDVTTDRVISPKLVREAQERELRGLGRGAFGLDVSRSAVGDWTSLYRWRDGVARLVDRWRGLPITAREGEDSTVARVYGHWKRTPAVPVVVDADGLGIGAFDGLVALGVLAKAFTLNRPARRPDRFDSRRSEVWWAFRKLMETGAVDLDPLDDRLAAQLQQPKWRQVPGKGLLHVETKAELAKRGVKSPDDADAVIMAALDAPLELDDPPGVPDDRVRSRRPAAESSMTVSAAEVAEAMRRPM